ncbi:MAG: ATP-grasp domain-containing protein [Lachnospiraceae bacterium]|nr:ATP-grasp domain-containing protein [Lachnospiraceae bacterium]
MNFVFISPNFPDAFARFCAGLHDNGVNVLGIGDAPYDGLNSELKYALTEYYKVDSLENYDQVVRAMGHFTWRYGKIDWVESNNEYWMEQDAALRTDFNITTGLKSDDIGRYRSKSEMKAFYAKAGVPTAKWCMATDLGEGYAFAEKTGYPIVVKPDRGVGAEATWKIRNDSELEAFFRNKPDVPYIMEEYVSGEITTFDGVCDSKGNVLFAASHIAPGSIMDMVNEGDPCFYYVNKTIPPEVRSAGERVLKAFRVRSRFFHLEFFRLTEEKEGLGRRGDIVGLEVNMRPAGGFTPDMLNFSQSADCFRIWADMVAFDENRHPYGGGEMYCVYCGRRDGVPYDHSMEDIGRRFGNHSRMLSRMPDALAGAMGNQVCIATFDTIDEMEEYVRYAFAPLQCTAITRW